MTLRLRLLLAQAPLAVALAAVALLSVLTVRNLGSSGNRILADNYRSVLAAQRMKDAIERIDSGALLFVGGEREVGERQIAAHLPMFEHELEVQEHNITESGEAERTVRLRDRWTAYRAALEEIQRSGDSAALREGYRERLEPAFTATRQAADQILALNQDAMVRKSDALRATSERTTALTLAAAAGALALGLWAAARLTRQAVQPLSVLSQAVRRIGQGDLEARARVAGSIELEQLAADFNAMADSLSQYRRSTIGELLQAQQASQAAIDSLPDPVVVFSAGGSLVNVNAASESLLGLTVESPSGEALSRLSPPVREVVERVRSHVLSGKGPYTPRGYDEALPLQTRDGVVHVLPRASPVYGEGKGIVGVTVILQDVTRLRRFDELKSDLVATVAHEVRTPLTSLRMAIHLCLEEKVGPLTEKQADLLYAARQDCERLQTIVDDLLDLTRLRSGRAELDIREVDARRLIDEALAPHRLVADEKEIRLSATVDPSIDRIWLDSDRVNLVLANLLTNAVRHTPEGGEVEVLLSPAGDELRFEVRDSGPGVPPDQRHRIFDRFYRVPGSEGGAAGLGLSIARDIVEAHGGAIGVDGAEGQGGRFWFTLPGRPPAQS